MNSKTVLSKIMALLSKDDVALTFAKLKDGTIVESSTFDVGEALDIVSEDGKKTPAPDGEHELSLRDSEGKETLIKVITKGGKIEERENVELEDVKVEDIPQASGDVPASEIAKDETNSVKMEEETEEVDKLPEDKDKEDMKEEEKEEKDIELGKKMEDMAYRIEEMEKKMKFIEEKMGEDKEKMEKEEEDEEEEDMELPKLDGAPVEVKMSLIETNSKNYGKKVRDSQSSFLSKLYK